MKKSVLVYFVKASLAVAGLALLSFLAVGITFNYWFNNSELTTSKIFFRSWESKTIHDESVYNTIRYFKKTNQEIWMMNQSHHGFNPAINQLDRLAIVISKNTAEFYQLPPGKLEWSELLSAQKINLKVDCRQCHSNGPRAIRPAPDFLSLMSFQEKTNLFLLNLRMKFYGHLESRLWMQDAELPENNFKQINSQTCLYCHNSGDQPWSRTKLTLQQSDSIRFLIGKKQMPPPGIQFSDEENQKLEQFLNLRTETKH